MLRVVNLNSDNEYTMSPETLPTLSLQNVWLKVIDPTPEELQAVADKTSIPENFLEIPETDGIVNLRLEDGFVIINFVILQDVITTKEVHPIVIAFTKNFIVTVSKSTDQSIIGIAKNRMNKSKVDPPSTVAYYILDEIVSNHFVQLEKIEELTGNLEEEVVEKNSSETLKKIFTLKSGLISLNKTLWYERGVIFNLHKCGDTCMIAKTRSLLDTTHEDLTRQINIVGTYREIMSDAINVHMSATSNKINLSIKSLTVVIFYLTIITTVTSFPNTVATFFGISQFGNTSTIIVLTTILLSMILPFLWLWRKKWLKYEQAVPAEAT